MKKRAAIIAALLGKQSLKTMTTINRQNNEKLQRLFFASS